MRKDDDAKHEKEKIYSTFSSKRRDDDNYEVYSRKECGTGLRRDKDGDESVGREIE